MALFSSLVLLGRGADHFCVVTTQNDKNRYLADWLAWNTILLGPDALSIIDESSVNVERFLQNNRSIFDASFAHKHVLPTYMRRRNMANASFVVPLNVTNFSLPCDEPRGSEWLEAKESVWNEIQSIVDKSMKPLFSRCSWTFHSFCFHMRTRQKIAHSLGTICLYLRPKIVCYRTLYLSWSVLCSKL